MRRRRAPHLGSRLIMKELFTFAIKGEDPIGGDEDIFMLIERDARKDGTLHTHAEERLPKRRKRRDEAVVGTEDDRAVFHRGGRSINASARAMPEAQLA